MMTLDHVDTKVNIHRKDDNIRTYQFSLPIRPRICSQIKMARAVSSGHFTFRFKYNGSYDTEDDCSTYSGACNLKHSG